MFIKLAEIICWLALVSGLVRLAMAIMALLSNDPVYFTQRYLGSQNTGYYIDQAIYGIVFAVTLGVLATIASDVRKIRRSVSNMSDEK